MNLPSHAFIHVLLSQGATSGVFKKIWNKIKEDPSNLVKNEMEGFRKVQEDGNYVFINEGTLIDLFMTMDCNLIKADETFFPRDLSFPIQRGSPYTRIFNQV